VRKVADDEGARVVGFVTAHANALASWSVRVEIRLAVDTQVQLSITVLDESVRYSIAFVEIGHIFVVVRYLRLILDVRCHLRREAPAYCLEVRVSIPGIPV
jgi:hypothetical protein